MRKKNIIAAVAMGIMMTFTTFTGTALADWNCPYGHEYCPGEDHCEEHRQCEEDGYCIHDTCGDGNHGENCANYHYSSRTSTRTSSRNSGCHSSGHHGSGHHHH